MKNIGQMTNTVDRTNDRLDKIAGENCSPEELAMESVQITPIYTMFTQHNLMIFVPL